MQSVIQVPGMRIVISLYAHVNGVSAITHQNSFQ